MRSITHHACLTGVFRDHALRKSRKVIETALRSAAQQMSIATYNGEKIAVLETANVSKQAILEI